jgi:hypothetical protein
MHRITVLVPWTTMNLGSGSTCEDVLACTGQSLLVTHSTYAFIKLQDAMRSNISSIIAVHPFCNSWLSEWQRWKTVNSSAL